MDEKKIISILSAIDDATEKSVFNEERFGFTKSEYNQLIKYLMDEGYVTGFFSVPIMDQAFKSYEPKNPQLTSMGIEYLEQNK